MVRAFDMWVLLVKRLFLVKMISVFRLVKFLTISPEESCNSKDKEEINVNTDIMPKGCIIENQLLYKQREICI